VGLGLSLPLIRLDGPRSKVTDRKVETVTGTITGGPAERLVLHVNGTTTEISAQSGSFKAPVSLERGPNQVRAVAVDAQGNYTEDIVTIEYAPRSPTAGIAITVPSDGHTLSPEDPPFVVVEGSVEDQGVSSAWLVVNGSRLPARVTGGRFRQVVPVVDTTVRIAAEFSPKDSAAQRSPEVRVLTATPLSSGALIMNWPEGTNGVEADIVVTWRSAPDRLDIPAVAVPARAFRPPSGAAPAEAFYLRNVTPGVYTFVLRYRTNGAPTQIQPTLVISQSDTMSIRVLRPMSLRGSGDVVLAKVLVPHGVLWDQDDWFTGQSQSAETVTKFRLPEGITWTERRSDLR
jgi:hypothetical protein